MAEVVSVVGGAALGLAFTELWKTVMEVKDHVKDFKPQLVNLERTLQSLDTIVQDIVRTQPNDEAIKHLESIMENGKKLVSKCRGASRLNFFIKAYRRNKLVELDNQLIRFNNQYFLPKTHQEVRYAREELSLAFNQISNQIERIQLSAAGDAAGGGGSVHPTPLIPPSLSNRTPTTMGPLPLPNNRAPSIDTLGRMLFVILPSIYVILKITAMIIIIYKAVTSIISILEKSESEIWMATKNVGELETTIELLDATMNSLAPVLEQIESNEADPGEDAEGLRSLLEEGEKLVRDSTNIGWWNFVKKWQCQNEMVELDNKLLRFHSLYLEAHLAKRKNSDDDSGMRDQESFEPSAPYGQDICEIKESCMDTGEYESHDKLNDKPQQFLHSKKPPMLGLSGGFKPHAVAGPRVMGPEGGETGPTQRDEEGIVRRFWFEPPAQNSDDESEMKDHESFEAPAHSDQGECAKLKRMLEESRQLVQSLRFERDVVVRLANREIEGRDQELAHARKEAELSQKDADAAESECAKLKRMLIEGKTVQRLIIEKDDEAELAKRQIEDMGQELACAQREAQYARNHADIAENEWTKVKRELKEKEELVKFLKLEIQETRQIAERQVEEIIQGLEDARKETEHARNDADIAQNEWAKAKKDLREKLELIEVLKLECLETRERAMRQVEEKELELADGLNAATAASSCSAVAQHCAVCLSNEKDMAFGCGHMTCEKCGMAMSKCPVCREKITHRIKLLPG